MDNSLPPAPAEQPNFIARSVRALVRRTRGSLSPWVQRLFQPNLDAPGPAAPRPSVISRWQGPRQGGMAAASTTSLVDRIHRIRERSTVWRGNLGPLNPGLVEDFSSQIVQRFPISASKFDLRPMGSETSEAPEMPLANGLTLEPAPRSHQALTPSSLAPSWSAGEPAPAPRWPAIGQPAPIQTSPARPPTPEGQRVRRFTRVEELAPDVKESSPDTQRDAAAPAKPAPETGRPDVPEKPAAPTPKPELPDEAAPAVQKAESAPADKPRFEPPAPPVGPDVVSEAKTEPRLAEPPRQFDVGEADMPPAPRSRPKRAQRAASEAPEQREPDDGGEPEPARAEPPPKRRPQPPAADDQAPEPPVAKVSQDLPLPRPAQRRAPAEQPPDPEALRATPAASEPAPKPAPVQRERADAPPSPSAERARPAEPAQPASQPAPPAQAPSTQRVEPAPIEPAPKPGPLQRAPAESAPVEPPTGLERQLLARVASNLRLPLTIAWPRSVRRVIQRLAAQARPADTAPDAEGAPEGEAPTPRLARSADVPRPAARPQPAPDRPPAQMPVARLTRPDAGMSRAAPAVTRQVARTQMLARGWRFKSKPEPAASSLAVTQPTASAPADMDVVHRTVSRIERGADAGRPLDRKPREMMEGMLGRDFGDVRVHTAPLSPLNVQAASRGRDVYFEPGQDQFDTPESLALLGHELTHVSQSGDAPAKPVSRMAVLPQAREISRVADDEAEAEVIERQVLRRAQAPQAAPDPAGRLSLMPDMPLQRAPASSEGTEAPPPAPGTPAPDFEEQLPPGQPVPASMGDTGELFETVSEGITEGTQAAYEGMKEAEAEEEEPLDLDHLARQVYPIIKRLLAVERERGGRW